MIKDINDYLVSVGLPVLGRSLTKATMKVKNFKDTKWNKKLQPYPCYELEKHDGINCILVNYEHNYMCFTREGKRMKNMEVFERFYSDKKYDYLVNSMINVEVCNDLLSLEELGAIIKSSRKKQLSLAEEHDHEETYLVAFDMVYLIDFLSGQSKESFDIRLEILQELKFTGFKIPDFIYCECEEDSEEFFNRIVERDGEGVVQVLPNSPWIAGYKNHYKTKKVCGVDYDLEIIDVEEGKEGSKREGMVANLVVRWRNNGDINNVPERLSVDGCYSDKQRIAWFKDPSLVVGSILHVHALRIGSQGSLRIAKGKEIRMDKFKADL